MRLPAKTVDYIIEFLLFQPNRNLISYSEVPTSAPITIVPAKSINDPVLPSNIRISRTPQTIIIKDDIIISTFFLLSRYDEYLQPEAIDIHSRFISSRSFLGANNLLQTPIVDLYTEFIYNLLNQPIPHRQQHIYLTHDIDIISQYHRPKGFFGGLYRSLFKKSNNKESLKTIISSAINVKHDPAYTFPLLQSLDDSVKDKHPEVIYFVKPNRARNRYDHPAYRFSSLPKLDGATGLHSLYETYDNPSLLEDPVCTDLPHKYHRSHYLRILPPTKMHHYVDAGITDDFTMAYADAPGFRLATTRPTLAINPATAELLPLTLHPLSIMETSLIDPRYLNLSYNQSLELSLSIISTINRHQGDITLLFHNSSFDNNIIKNLYPKILESLDNLE